MVDNTKDLMSQLELHSGMGRAYLKQVSALINDATELGELSHAEQTRLNSSVAVIKDDLDRIFLNLLSKLN